MRDLIPCHRRDRRHHGLRRGGEGAGDPGGVRLRLVFLAKATPLPARVGIVAAYFSGLADNRPHRPPCRRDGYRHKMAGHEPPTYQEGVRAVLRGIHRTIGAAREGRAPSFCHGNGVRRGSPIPTASICRRWCSHEEPPP
jgi:hypothetical protein